MKKNILCELGRLVDVPERSELLPTPLVKFDEKNFPNNFSKKNFSQIAKKNFPVFLHIKIFLLQNLVTFWGQQKLFLDKKNIFFICFKKYCFFTEKHFWGKRIIASLVKCEACFLFKCVCVGGGYLLLSVSYYSYLIFWKVEQCIKKSFFFEYFSTRMVKFSGGGIFSNKILKRKMLLFSLVSEKWVCFEFISLSSFIIDLNLKFIWIYTSWTFVSFCCKVFKSQKYILKKKRFSKTEVFQ